MIRTRASHGQVDDRAQVWLPSRRASFSWADDVRCEAPKLREAAGYRLSEVRMQMTGRVRDHGRLLHKLSGYVLR
jgi:hypothetical protein